MERGALTCHIPLENKHPGVATIAQLPAWIHLAHNAIDRYVTTPRVHVVLLSSASRISVVKNLIGRIISAKLSTLRSAQLINACHPNSDVRWKHTFVTIAITRIQYTLLASRM